MLPAAQTQAGRKRMRTAAVPYRLNWPAHWGPMHREIQHKRLICEEHEYQWGNDAARFPQVMYNFWQEILRLSWLKKQRQCRRARKHAFGDGCGSCGRARAS